MKTAVHFGLGKIGRGFLGELLHNSGYQLVFIDVVDALVDRINETHSYTLFSIDRGSSALERKYGFTHESLVDYMETMMLKRFLLPGIADAIVRVSREPIRKLAPNDRIMGPAYLCEEYGLKNTHLLKGAACAMLFQSPEDPQAVELQDFIAENGIEKAITKYTGAEPGSRMFSVIREEYGKFTKA